MTTAFVPQPIGIARAKLAKKSKLLQVHCQQGLTARPSCEMPTPEETRNRIQWFIDAAGCESQKAFAKLVQVSVESVSRWMTGENPPSRSNQARIARSLGLPAAEVFAFLDRGDPVRSAIRVSTNGHSSVARSRPPNWPTGKIPLVGRVPATKGAQGMSDHTQYGSWAEKWVDQGSVAGPNSQAFTVKGDSMVPTLHPGWTVVADPDVQIVVGQIVVIQTYSAADEVNCIKRVAGLDNDSIRLTSDNPRADAATFSREDIAWIGAAVEYRVSML